MPNERSGMTARVVPLDSPEASDSAVGGTAVQRLLLVAELSEAQWALTRRPLPTYTRETMPAAVAPLRASAGHD